MTDRERIARENREALTHEIHRASELYYSTDHSPGGVSFFEYLAMHLSGAGYTRQPEHELAERPIIVCLCGSTRFKDAFTEWQLKETLAGKIVLTIGCNMRSDTEIFGNLLETEFTRIKIELDELHKRKIDLSDEVLILNVGGYIGESTRSEIEYATSKGKTIRYLEGHPNSPYEIPHIAVDKYFTPPEPPADKVEAVAKVIRNYKRVFERSNGVFKPLDKPEDLAREILKLFPEYEPVELEVLGDKEIRKYYLGSRLTAVKDAIQATIRHNQKGQLYRVKEE